MASSTRIASRARISTAGDAADTGLAIARLLYTRPKAFRFNTNDRSGPCANRGSSADSPRSRLQPWTATSLPEMLPEYTTVARLQTAQGASRRGYHGRRATNLAETGHGWSCHLADQPCRAKADLAATNQQVSDSLVSRSERRYYGRGSYALGFLGEFDGVKLSYESLKFLGPYINVAAGKLRPRIPW